MPKKCMESPTVNTVTSRSSFQELFVVNVQCYLGLFWGQSLIFCCTVNGPNDLPAAACFTGAEMH